MPCVSVRLVDVASKNLAPLAYRLKHEKKLLSSGLIKTIFGYFWVTSVGSEAQTPIRSVSGQHTTRLNSPRKDLAHPYKVSTPVTSSKHSRRIGKKKWNTLGSQKKQQIRPAWKF